MVFEIVHDLFNFIHDVEGVELEAMASIPAEYEKVQELAKANHVKKTYECYEEMLADNDVDVIYLGVPNHLHYAMCKQALEAGKHVICETSVPSFLNNLNPLKLLAGVVILIHPLSPCMFVEIGALQSFAPIKTALELP